MCKKYRPGWFAKAKDKWINKNTAKITCYLGDSAYSGTYTAHFLTHSTEIYSCGLQGDWFAVKVAGYSPSQQWRTLQAARANHPGWRIHITTKEQFDKNGY